jgi:hypothetical protein
MGIAVAVACGGVACSLITSLDDPTSKVDGSADASSDQNAASDASPIIVASLGDDAGVVGLYVDSQTSNLFFTATNLGNVYEIADGGTTLVIPQLARPDRITGSFAADRSSVVYVAAFGPSAAGVGIFRLIDDGGVSAAVGTGSFVASGSTFPLHPYGIAVFASTQPTIYWTNCNDPSPTPSCNSANSQIIETDFTKGMSTVRATITADFARDIVTTDDMVLWDTATAMLYAQSLDDGGAAQVLEPTCAGVIYYAPAPVGNLVSARIYFTSAAGCGTSNTIEYRDLSNLSTAKQTFAMNNVNTVFSMTSDGTYLYWANHGDGTIVRQPVNGTSSEVVVTSPAAAGPPKQLVVSRGVLYWTTDSSVVSYTLPP